MIWGRNVINNTNIFFNFNLKIPTKEAGHCFIWELRFHFISVGRLVWVCFWNLWKALLMVRSAHILYPLDQIQGACGPGLKIKFYLGVWSQITSDPVTQFVIQLKCPLLNKIMIIIKTSRARFLLPCQSGKIRCEIHCK